MRLRRRGLVLGIAVLAGWPMGAVMAEEAVTTQLPVLLIKGEVVSLDANDPAAALLKVKDRYGFETPIYVTPEAKITQGEAAVPITGVTVGASVAVEYNFDVNTAKRHAVSVKLSTASAPASQVSAATSVPAPAAQATPAPVAESVTATATVTPDAPAAATPADAPAAPPASTEAAAQ